MTTEILDEFKMGSWCFRGITNIKEKTSEESDALWEAYRDMGLMEAQRETPEQCESLENTVKDKQLPTIEKENTPELLTEEPEDEDLEQRTLKVCSENVSILNVIECVIKLNVYMEIICMI